MSLPNVVLATSCSSEKTATINISLDFSESFIPNLNGGWIQRNKLPGVQTDRTTMRKLNSTFFNSTETMEFTDADAIELETSGSTSQRASFINKIKKFATDFRRKNGPSSQVMINISTHGVRCKTRNGEIQWGFIIPEKRLDLRSAAPQRNDPEYLFNCEDTNFQKLFVSAKDLVDSTEPNGIIIDTCYAGHFEKNLISINDPSLKKSGFFILTSSNDFLTTSEEYTENKKNKVGPLFHALKQLVESPEICQMDLNSDGELSQDEVAFYMLGFYVQLAKDEMPVASLLLDFDQVVERRQHYLDMTSNLGTAKSGQSCLMKIPDKFNCSKPFSALSHSRSELQCSEKQKQVSEIHEKILNLFPINSSHSLFRYKSELSPSEKNFTKNLQVVGDSRNQSTKNFEVDEKPVIFARDSRRKEALNFFEEYLKRLTREFNEACPNKNEASIQCAAQLNQIKNLKSELEKIVSFYKINKK